MIETKAGSFEPESRLLIDGELTGAAKKRAARYETQIGALREALVARRGS